MDNFLKIFAGRWKLLTITFAAGFLMVVLPSLGLRLPKLQTLLTSEYRDLINPVRPENDPLTKLLPKLEQKPNQFKIKKKTGIIQGAQAAGDYTQASSYIVIDSESGQILAEKSSSERYAIASLTKIMTAIVALDLVSTNEYFDVSPAAARQQPTKLALTAGDKLTLEELLNALLLSSANDCAKVIQEGIDQRFGKGLPAPQTGPAGRQGVFVRAMNAKAKFLNLKNTQFENPAGFDGIDHLSSAEDVAILSQYALKNYPLVENIVKKSYSELFSNPNHQRYEYLNNCNGLIGVYPGVAGVKIGNTEKAGHTTSVVSQRDGKKVLAVLFGAPGVLERDLWASQLLDLGFEKGWGFTPVGITEEQLREKYASWKYFN